MFLYLLLGFLLEYRAIKLNTCGIRHRRHDCLLCDGKGKPISQGRGVTC